MGIEISRNPDNRVRRGIGTQALTRQPADKPRGENMKRILTKKQFWQGIMNPEVLEGFKNIEEFADFHNLGGIEVKAGPLQIVNDLDEKTDILTVYEIMTWDDQNGNNAQGQIETYEVGVLHGPDMMWAAIPYCKTKA